MGEPRIASHDDDPAASFADRLLLALGIWPHHAEQIGQEETLDAVVMIRTAAHKFPMAAEDFGTERELREDYEAIVRDLANAASRPDGSCKFCGAGTDHTDACIWVRARLLTAEECAFCGGLGDCVRCDGDGCGAESTSDGYCLDGTCPHCAGTGLEPFADGTQEAP